MPSASLYSPRADIMQGRREYDNNPNADLFGPASSLELGADPVQELSPYFASSFCTATSSDTSQRYCNDFFDFCPSFGYRCGFVQNEQYPAIQRPSQQPSPIAAGTPAAHSSDYISPQTSYGPTLTRRDQSMHYAPPSQLPDASATSPSVLARNAYELYHDYDIVPQRRYHVPIRHGAEPFHPQDPVMFSVGRTYGILVKDALEEKFSGLNGSHDQLLLNDGASISLRFEWPGYSSYTHQIAARDYRKNPKPITRAKLAKKVANELERYIKKVDGTAIDEEYAVWRLGRGFIDVDRLILVRLDHVSKASYQPQFRFVH